MLKTAKTNPVTFFAVCARLIGPEVKLTIEQSLPGNLSMEDWQVMREVVSAVARPFLMLAHSLQVLCFSMCWPSFGTKHCV